MSKEEFKGVVGMYNRITAKQEAMYWTTKQKKALIELEIAEAKKTKLMADLRKEGYPGNYEPKLHAVILKLKDDQNHPKIYEIFKTIKKLCDIHGRVNIKVGTLETSDDIKPEKDLIAYGVTVSEITEISE